MNAPGPNELHPKAAAELIRASRWMAASGRQAVCAGLVGRGINRSRTPRLHEIEGHRQGIPYRYILLDFDALALPNDDLASVIASAREAGLAGLNVTHPFKEAVLPFLDRLSPDAEGVGAVNTVAFTPEGVIGHNTDCWGFEQSFHRTLVDADMANVLVLGAGGGGRAIIRALAALGARTISVFDPDRIKAARTADFFARSHLSVRAVADAADAAAWASGIVNTSPIGMHGYPGIPIPPSAIAGEPWVADIVYFPSETELITEARRRRLPVLTGVGMAVFQAAKAFEIFTGRPADIPSVIASFESASPDIAAQV